MSKTKNFDFASVSPALLTNITNQTWENYPFTQFNFELSKITNVFWYYYGLYHFGGSICPHSLIRISFIQHLNLKETLVTKNCRVTCLAIFEQLEYTKLKDTIQIIFRVTEINIIICFKKIINLLGSDITIILIENHDSPHSSFHRAYNRIKLNYYCSQIVIRDLIKKCKSSTIRKICIDIVDPLPITKNENQYICTMHHSYIII